MTQQKRLKPEARKADILRHALALAEQVGYMHLTRAQISAEAEVTGPVLNYYWGTMAQFRRALIQYAVQTECLPVIAQGVVNGDATPALDDPLRKRALASLR